MVQFDPETYEPYRFDESRHFQATALWDALDAEGRRVCVIDWPRGPFGKIANGVLLDNWLQHDPPSPARSFPEALARDVVERYGADPFGAGLHQHTLETGEAVKWAIETCRARIAAKTRFCVDQLRGGEWDLFAPVFSEPHDLGHYAFHLHDCGHPKFDPVLAAVGDPLREICLALDRALAEIIAAAGEDCEVMMLTGPGMAPLATANGVMELIAKRLDLGLPAEETPAAKAREAYRSAIPSPIRGALSPIKRFILGEPKNPEYRRRRFFAVPGSDHAGCIRVNVKGRERDGTVSPGADYDRLIETIVRDFSEIRDADTGEPVVGDIVRTRQIYRGPAAAVLPDLFIPWRRERPLRRIASLKIGVIDVPERKMRTGDHTSYGGFWARRERLASLATGGPLRPHGLTGAILASARRESAGARTGFSPQRKPVAKDDFECE